MGKRIVGYYTSWSIYQRDFQVADIPAAKLTHVNYAFANVDGESGECKLGDIWSDDANFWSLGGVMFWELSADDGSLLDALYARLGH